MVSGFTFFPSESEIFVTVSGNYLVDFSVATLEPSQFTLFVNGSPESDAIYGSAGAGK